MLAVNCRTRQLKSFGWLFAALSLTALLSQPGAIHNEWSHAAGIWCGRGERALYCPEIENSSDGMRLAKTNIAFRDCWSTQTAPRICPTIVSAEAATRTPISPTWSVFNYSYSWLVVPSVDVSLLIIRLANALVLTTVLSLLFGLLPRQYQIVTSFLILVVCTTPGIFLLTSASPITWMTIGVGVGWLPLHAAFAPSGLERSKRKRLAACGALLVIAGLASDRNSLPQFVTVLTLLSCHLAWLHFPLRRASLLQLLSVAGVTFVISMEWLSSRVTRRLLIPKIDGQTASVLGSTNGSFGFMKDLFPAVPKVADLMVSFPGWDVSDPRLLTVSLPEIVGFGSIALLGVFFVRTANRDEPLQAGGVLAILIVLSLLFYATASIRDTAIADPTIAYPLVVFLIGWWLLLAPNQRLVELEASRKSAAIIATCLFALTVFTTAERFVDRQSFGLRYLPEGRDQWWWSWMPISPNVVLILTPLLLWMFFSSNLSASRSFAPSQAIDDKLVSG